MFTHHPLHVTQLCSSPFNAHFIYNIWHVIETCDMPAVHDVATLPQSSVWSSLPTERLWGWKFGTEQQMTCRAVMFYHQVWLRQKAGGFLQYCDWQAAGEKSHILSYNFVFVSSQQDQRSSLCLSQFPQVSAVIIIWGCLGFFFFCSATHVPGRPLWDSF